MRLVRLAQQPSRVAEDVRAALASLGRGSTVVGGVALVGARPFGADRILEAVVVLPQGVLIVIGVDLPDPAMLLEAPLDGPWKADGWPLVHGDDRVNPATEALELSRECARRISSVAPGAGPVGTIVAVGPYVDAVDQPPADLAGTVRVLYPTPTTMLAATVSLATAARPRSVEQARALIGVLAPDAPPLTDEMLLGEGFSAFSDNEPTIIRENPLAGITPTVPAAHPGKPQAEAETKTPAKRPAATVRAVRPPVEPPAVPVQAAAAGQAPGAAQTAAAVHTPAVKAPGAAVAQAPAVTSPAVQTPAVRTPARPAVQNPPAEAPARPAAPAQPSSSTGTPQRQPQVTPPAPAQQASRGSASAGLPAAPASTKSRPGQPRRSRTVRWLPLAALGLLAVLLVAAISVASSGDDTAAPATTPPPAPVSSAPPTSTSRPVENIQFTSRAIAADQKCASHGFGDVQASLQRTSCAEVRRASFAATIDGRQAAVSVGIVEFASAEQASAFKDVADTPGSGGLLDLATETGQWEAEAPRFDGAAYQSLIDGKSVRLVQVVWVPGPSAPDDPGLVRAAKAALNLPVNT
ncbi:hypothetical protein [Amycolatopsis sp. H20-H5]|uniref:hypothetical protein n=1 Tax=Amycolatopsis sp. H20-H5 TaxID=3046309 RepID=UPI002DBFBF18|nr:hypothetical protein [Amycolatopsis sp. H20-H5]MEC3979392.1 hypothetical protein [Amycolatopsis sp. H20-H5]